ncbi:sialidase family protein [Amycolatopsis mongoliensis]|uniref:Sialidase family protein n=1 Tax=Amycolatopsis mongoliensis TaxID=715475 RepID=A0A9Y2NMC5_9PSEU|nr:sialidase family protein [Amycolatopsis sp. 4-36]WIY03210.1 sialidase family protein [Amycolatopsis sp. 4-36]
MTLRQPDSPLGVVRTIRPTKPTIAYGQDTQHSAFPSVTRLPDNTLYVVFRQGSNHYANRDGFLRSTAGHDNGKTWSAPATVVAASAGVDYRDPSVSLSRTGTTLYLTYFKGTTAVGAAGSFFRSSTDGGATWGAEVRIDANLPSSAITAPVVQLADGTLLAAHYSKAGSETFDSVWIARSSDNGATWTSSRVVNGQTAGRDYQEPYLVQRDTALFLTFRWGNNASIGTALSTDNGTTWSTPAAAFAGTGRPSSVWLADDTIVVYLRDAARRFAVRATRDRGATWLPPYVVQTPAKGGMSTYASMLETTPGQVFTVLAAEDSTSTDSRLACAYLGSGAQETPLGFVPGEQDAARSGYDQLVLGTTFQQPNGGLPIPWWTGNGAVTVTDGVLRSASADNVADHAVLETSSADHRVEADFLWTGQAGFGVFLRYTDASNYLLFTAETGGVNLRVYKAIGGTLTQLVLATGKPVNAGGFHTLAAAVRAGTVTAAVNGETLIHFDLSSGDNTALSGTAAGVKINEQAGGTNQCRRIVVTG